MTAIARKDRGQSPGTQTAGSPEGPVADAKMQAEVTIVLAGTPAQIAADYATITGTALTSSSALCYWKKG